MNQAVQYAAAGIVAPRVLSKIKLRWIVAGVAAYYGLRYLAKNGIFEKQAGAAVDAIDKGIDTIKNETGLGANPLPH